MSTPYFFQNLGLVMFLLGSCSSLRPLLLVNIGFYLPAPLCSRIRLCTIETPFSLIKFHNLVPIRWLGIIFLPWRDLNHILRKLFRVKRLTRYFDILFRTPEGCDMYLSGVSPQNIKGAREMSRKRPSFFLFFFKELLNMYLWRMAYCLSQVIVLWTNYIQNFRLVSQR